MLTMRSGLSRDGWAGLVVLIFSSVLFALTFNLPEMPLVPVGPGFYPRILLCFTGGLGLWLLIADSRRFKTVEGMKPGSVIIDLAAGQQCELNVWLP